MSINYLNDFNAVCQNIWNLGAIKLTILVILSYQLVAARDYDERSRDFYGDFTSDESYGDLNLLEMSTNQKDHIVRLHNRLRNKIALGEIRRFDSASRMPALRWSDELARLAETKARACADGREECKKDKYRNQNIARRGCSDKINEPPTYTMSSMIMDWFLEYRDGDMSNIYSSNNRPQGFETINKDIENFAVMMNDRNSAVGCAMIRSQEDGLKFDHLVCNYGYATNRKPVYERGSAASRCKERHSTYEGLCRNSNNVDDRRLLTLFFR
ncbi:antigen 5 like allergen Cul n 1-like [Sitodiplosis mosellana]|uniref:antigen 5 like allergen Cul n 1-like n=1 Tax=Sitodiplosis mosellana TaxID=263140 RepID=UPI002445192F|nr:antigen 5 like allergen Cul n 1-like [Sitodiplosis mosellana]